MRDIVHNKQLLKELKKLNPTVTFLAMDSSNPWQVQIDCAPEKLNLPKPFYYSEKNGITNKHKTNSGIYTFLLVNDNQV